MKYFLILISFFYSLGIQAQEDVPKKMQVGLELDVLPFATGGYFGAGWAGKDVWRLRALTAFVNKPDWSTTRGFFQPPGRCVCTGCRPVSETRLARLVGRCRFGLLGQFHSIGSIS